ncbi:MAG: phage portal protein [Cyanobacteria bacterium J06638_7]
MSFWSAVRHAFAVPGARPRAQAPHRTTGGVPTLYGPSDQVIRGGLRRWRAEARYQCRFNPYAAQARRTLMVNLIGPKGIKMIGGIHKRVQGGSLSTNEKDEAKNSILEREWKRFCRAENFDLAGRRSFLQYEAAVANSLPPDGGCMVWAARVPAPMGENTLRFQLLSMQQLDDDYNGPTTAAGRFWHLGIEYEQATGRVANYAILPGNINAGRFPQRKHVIVPASEIRHIFIPEEIEQTREVPWLLPGITTIHQLNEYEKAHWVKKRNAANTLGFIKRPPADVAPAGTLPNEAPDPGELTTADLIARSSAGQYIELADGEEIETPDLGGDDNQYPEVVRTMLRRFAAALSLSYATLSRDFTQMNWATLRQAVLEDRDYYRSTQGIIIQQFHQWVYELWLDDSVVQGVLPIRLFGDYLVNPDPYLTPGWQPRSWKWVDPLKETKALIEARKGRLETLAGQIAETTGEDLETVVAQLAYEEKLLQEAGLGSLCRDSGSGTDEGSTGSGSSP